jgi:uncharacterized protein YfaS (alpha-2-macroglobulin family)
MRAFFSVFHRFFPASAALAGLVLGGLLTGCDPSSNKSDGVELLASTDPLHAASTFEVRFDQPMVGPEVVGRTNAPSPLEVRPRLRGTFTWTSPRGGTFTPDEPLALGTTYTFTLRRGLTNAAGQPAGPQLRRSLATPAFALLEVVDVPRADDCPAALTLRLLFNAPVAAAAAEPFFAFESAAGVRIPAVVTQGQMSERRWGFAGGTRELCTWEEWFHTARAVGEGNPAAASTNPAPNLLLVSPREPLPPGTNWSLVVRGRLPMAGGGAVLPTERRVALGTVLPFAPVGVSAHNTLGEGRTLRLRFTKRLDPTLATNFAGFLAVSPPVSNLTATVWGTLLSLHGDFARQSPYSVTVRAGLPAFEGLRLADEFTEPFSVPPVASRLYFPAVEAGQFAAGRRTFPLLVMNVDKVRVRAKRLDDASLIHGLRGFGRAYQTADPAGEGNFSPVNYELIPGRTIFDETFPGTTTADEAVTLPLDWNRILGAGGKGAVFLCAERVGDGTIMRLPPGFVAPVPVALGVEATVQVTDLGLVWKTTASELLAFVFSLQTGAPVPAAEVRLLGDEGEPLAHARTDTAGLARLPLAATAVWLTARTGDGDTLAIEWRREQVPMWQFDLPRAWGDEAAQPERKVHLFTDRDLYRPGETIHLKGIVREWRGDRLSLPATNRGTLTLRDYRDSAALTTNVTLSADGTFALDFPLPREARQGRYDLQARFGEATAWLGVQVREFRPRAFEIQIAARPAYAAGEPVALPVTAKYLFGRPLDRAQARWTLQFSDRAPESPHFEGFQFARAWREASLGRGTVSGTLTGEARLEGTNVFLLRAEPGTNALAPQPRHATLAVEITDQNQQTLSEYAGFVRHSSDFYLGVQLDREVLEAGTPIQARAVAIAPDGSPLTNAVSVTQRVFRVEWQTVRLLGAGGASSYRSEAVVTNLQTRAFPLATAPPAAPRAPEANAPVTYQAPSLPSYTPDLPGEYLLELTATDAAGRPVVCSESFHVSAPRERLAWNYRNAVQIELLPDRPAYAPGDTATVLLKTPISGTALVTIERAEVRRSFVTRLDGNAPAIRVPLLPGDAPNVAVFVTLLRGAAESAAATPEPEYRLGACQLLVEDPTAKLTVALSLNATNHLPGALVEAGALVRDHAGQPVAGAEVTLYAVDEGVLAMSAYQLPDLLGAFHEPRPIRVNTGLSLPFLLPEDTDHQHFANKGYVIGDGKESGGRVRRDFAACAFWHAALRTDAAGQVRAQFPAPDSITRYRLLAVVVRAPEQFGGAELPFSVSKPLVLEPALPPMARRTDELLARAVVLNQTDTAGEVEVSLTLDGTATAKDPSRLAQRVAVAARGSAVVEIPLQITATGQARWVWRARFTTADAPTFTDAVESTLEVLPPAPLLVERRSLTLNSPTNLLAGVNPQMLHGEGGVLVTLANTRLVGLADVVPQLLRYPYGCAEQTGSSLLPWLVVRDTPALAPLLMADDRDAGAAIRRGVQRLLDLRTQGGVAYWPGAREPMPWATAYATLVLGLAQRNGVELPASALSGLVEQLAEGLPAALTNRAGIATGCLALYALAVADDARPAWHEKFFEQRSRLSDEARALLALAIHLADGPEPMARELLTGKGAADAVALEYSSPTREQALRLLAWVNVQPAATEIGPLVDALMTRLTAGAAGSTQDDAWSLLALSAYAGACEAEPSPVAGTLTWQGVATPFALEGNQSLARFQFPRAGTNASDTLPLAMPAGARLFARLEVSAVPPGREQAAQDHGFRVSRTYTALGETNQPLSLAGLRVGDRVLVTLRVALPAQADYLALDDPLPAVLEAMLPDFRGGPTLDTAGVTGWDGFSDFRELRSDRALFFANNAPAGLHEIRYLARVRAAGVATAPACKVEAMYRPEQYGLSASQVVRAVP